MKQEVSSVKIILLTSFTIHQGSFFWHKYWMYTRSIFSLYISGGGSSRTWSPATRTCRPWPAPPPRCRGSRACSQCPGRRGGRGPGPTPWPSTWTGGNTASCLQPGPTVVMLLGAKCTFNFWLCLNLFSASGRNYQSICERHSGAGRRQSTFTLLEKR